MRSKTLTYLGISLTLAGFADQQAINNSKHTGEKNKVEPIVENNKRSREQWKKQLEDLAKSPTPTKLKMGAMCYKMAMPYAGSYNCSKCKSKTVFAKGDSKRFKAGQLEKKVSKHLIELRKLGLDVKIDSSFLCSKCGKGDDFYWEISNGDKIVRTKCEYFDFYILRDFLKKKEVVTGATERQKPLKKYIPRLKELLLGETKEKK